MEFDLELIDDFVVESIEHIDGIEPDLLEMEQAGDAAKETWNCLFRALHSVKGAAGFLGLDNIQEMPHVSASLPMLLRDGEPAPSEDSIGLLVDGVSDVIDVEESQIEDPPPALAECEGAVVLGVVQLDGETLQIVAPSKLLVFETELA